MPGSLLPLGDNGLCGRNGVALDSDRSPDTY